MTIVITLGLHTGYVGGIFIMGIFGNFYTKRVEFLTFKTGIPGGLGVTDAGQTNVRQTTCHGNGAIQRSA